MSTPHDHLRCPPLLLLTAGLALGDLLLWDVSPGLGAALAVLLLAGLPLVAHREVARGRHLLAVGGLVVALALGLVLTGATLGLVLAPVVLGIWAVAVGSGPGSRFVALVVEGVRGLVFGAWSAVQTVIGLRGLRHGSGWVLPIVLTGVFAVLLGLANPVIGEVWSRLGDLLSGVSVPEPGRLGLWLLLAAVTGAALWYRQADPASAEGPVAARAGSVAAPVRFLLLANLLFAAQHLLDLRYLVGGAALPEGMTYAGYAHRGCYPLIATALLAGVVVLWWFRPGSPAERDATARRLVLAWLAQNALLVAAAAWRLHLYIDAYGLSRWRVAAAVWMIVVMVGLGLVAWRLARGRSNAWLASATTLTTAGVLILTTWVPVDAVIAWHNVRHCRDVGGAGVAADLEYLADLDASAAPALAWLSDQSRDPTVAAQAAEIARTQASVLAARRSTWRGWTALE